MRGSDIERILRSSRRIVVADGAGAPWSALPGALESFRGEVFVGWCLSAGLALVEPSPTTPFRSFMGGNGARRIATSPHFSYVPIRFSHLPRAFGSWLGPYTLLLTAVPRNGEWHLATEAGWIPAAIEHAEHVVVVPNDTLPCTTALGAIAVNRFVVGDPVHTPAEELVVESVDDASARIGEIVASLLPDDAAIQYGPGPIGVATLAALQRPVRIRSGIVSDAVLDGVRRGVITGTPRGSYAVGTRAFYDEINGRGWVDRVEATHDHASLAADTFVAVNTALEVDTAGQVNVETVKGRVVAGLGGHADFAFAAASSRRGLSIVALPSKRGDAPTLVDHLDTNVTTQRSDIDVFVNENGFVDVRGMSDSERTRALRNLWGT